MSTTHYLVKRRTNNKAVAYRAYPINNSTYHSDPASPIYCKDGKWIGMYDPDGIFPGLTNDDITKYSLGNDPVFDKSSMMVQLTRDGEPK